MKLGLLIVGNFLSDSTGVRGVCEDVAARLGASGWPVIVTSKHPGRLSRLLDMVTTAWRARHAYTVAQVDVYSGLAYFWAEAVCWTLRRASKPYVLTLHGGNLPAFARRWPLRVRSLLGSAAAVTTPSLYLRQQMQPYCSDLRLLPNPLELRAYSFRLRRRPEPHLMWLRAFHAVYNPALAPRVLARLLPDYPGAHLTMVGPDKGDGSLPATRQVAQALAVADRLSFPGAVAKTEVPAWLNRGDVFLNTTNVDNTPVSVLEAMACGLCVVSTNVGGIPYLLQHGHDALLVPPDDANAMAAAVCRLLSDPELAAHLSRNARRKARHFDWSAILPQWQRLLTAAADHQT